MKRMKKIWVILLVVMSIFVCAIPASAATVKAKAGQKKSVSITAGRTATLKMSGVSAKKVKWTSSNKKVAVVSSKGKLTAKKAGKATIVAKYGKKKATFKVKVYSNEWKCSQQDPSKWEYNASRVCFNSLKMSFKNGKLYVTGFWSNTEYINYTKVVATVSIYDRNNSNKLIAQKDVTYTNYLPARTYNGKMTYVFSGNEIKAKNYDLRKIAPFTFSYIY